MTPKFRLPALIAIGALLSSCGDDPALVAKRDQQAAEIARLQSELALIHEELRTLPPDPGQELIALEESGNVQAAEISRLEAELQVLNDRKQVLEEEFSAYRAKHPLP